MAVTDRELLLQLIGSLTLSDHMGDAANNVDRVLNLLGIEIVEDGDDFLDAVAKKLHSMGVTSLYGTSLGGEDEEEEES